ncbi:hypothetical protein CB1_000436027 [Camelus ferus]|nr:hypothetical protein CB1_000436027 [Camelus ferus]
MDFGKERVKEKERKCSKLPFPGLLGRRTSTPVFLKVGGDTGARVERRAFAHLRASRSDVHRLAEAVEDAPPVLSRMPQPGHREALQVEGTSLV